MRLRLATDNTLTPAQAAEITKAMAHGLRIDAVELDAIAEFARQTAKYRAHLAQRYQCRWEPVEERRKFLCPTFPLSGMITAACAGPECITWPRSIDGAFLFICFVSGAYCRALSAGRAAVCRLRARASFLKLIAR
jgi:hypothetical protein